MANQFKNFKEHPPAEVFAYLAPNGIFEVGERS